MPEDKKVDDVPQGEAAGPGMGHQNLGAAVLQLERRYRDLLYFTGGIIATLTIERNQPEFAKIPAFHVMAKSWIRRFEIQFGASHTAARSSDGSGWFGPISSEKPAQ